MKRLGRNRPPTFYDVGWHLIGESLSPFNELRLPDATVRLLDKRVHLKALDDAERKFTEFLRQTRHRNP